MHEVGSVVVCDEETWKGLEVALSSPPCWWGVPERKTLLDDACTLAPGSSKEKVSRMRGMEVGWLVFILVSCSPAKETSESHIKSSAVRMLEVSVKGRPFTFWNRKHKEPGLRSVID